MEFLPRTLGTRPRLACEVRAEGVVAARAEDASGLLSAVSRVGLADGTVVPELRLGNAEGTLPGAASVAADRAAVVAAVRKALEAVALRGREVTLVVPDAAVRVLLLDFDALPSKALEALPVVRFRLKKLLPFDADDAAISYQVMATSKGIVRVVAVAMPREVLAEYEAVVREAGFEPGAILPSTLAALAGLPENDAPMLVVNAGHQGVTTAIVKAGVLLLHRSVDLRVEFGTADPRPIEVEVLLPLVNRESSAEEWALQQPVEYSAAAAISAAAELHAAEEAVAAIQTAVLEQEIVQEIAAERGIAEATNEVAQAISVAAAYFEDTLESTPRVVLSTGTMGAEALSALLEYAGVGPVPVEEMVGAQMLGPGAAGAAGRVPLGWLAGVRGALAD
jgi:type IV pilus assembly protein PilM